MINQLLITQSQHLGWGLDTTAYAHFKRRCVVKGMIMHLISDITLHNIKAGLRCKREMHRSHINIC